MRTKYLLLALSCCIAASSLMAEKFFCNLKALTPEQRQIYQKLSRDLGSAVTARSELPDGYTFQIDSAKMPVTAIAEWITLERRCCPFFQFRLDLEGRNEIVSLSLRGPAGVKEFIEMEFHR